MLEELSNKNPNWQKHLKDQVQSGLSKRAYCKEKQLKYSSFNYHWKKHHKQSSSKKALSLSAFETVKLHQNPGTKDLLEIYFPNGTRFKVSDLYRPFYLG